MKTIHKYLYLFLVAIATGGVLLSCSDDDEGGTPFVNYVRVTDPDASDSLLVSAGQGQMVAIMGRNLDGVRELWFNDQPAVLNPSFITNTSIISRVPSQIPAEITNQMKLVFANGQTVLHDFSTDISEPRVDRIKSEYVADNGIVVFYGDFFYEPLTVTFTGGVEGEIDFIENNEVHVVVPAGAEPGPVTLTSNFGVTVTNQWFRDNRNIIASFDGSTSGMWHGPNYIVSSDPVIQPVAGKFIRMKSNLSAWGWYELYVGPIESDASLELKNIPEDAFANPDDYSLKFELNTLKTLSGAHVRMFFGADMPTDRGSLYYNWQPNIHTNGEWETVTIPWKDVYAGNNKNGTFVYNPAGYGVSIHFSGPNAVTGDFALDNMRVVPTVSE